jgi:hypothetical protein
MNITSREFRFSQWRLRGRVIIGGILVLLAAEFCLSAFSTESTPGGKVGAIFFLGFMLIMAVPGFLLWKKAEDSIHIDKQEIVHVSRSTGSFHIPWASISEIRETNDLFRQQLKLFDARQRITIVVDSALQDAASLVQFIYTSTPHLRSTYTRQQLFHRDKTILLSYLMLPLILGLLLCGSEFGWRTAGLLFGGVSLFSGLLFLREIQTVQVNVDHFLLIYPLWRRRLAYTELRALQLVIAPKILLAPDFFNESAIPVIAIVLELNSGKHVQLSCFKEGTLTLYGTLRATWEHTEAKEDGMINGSGV